MEDKELNKLKKKWEKDCQTLEKNLIKNDFCRRYHVSHLKRWTPDDGWTYPVIYEVVNKCDCCGRHELKLLGPPFQIPESQPYPEATEVVIKDVKLDFLGMVGAGIDREWSVAFAREIDTAFYYIERW